MNITRLQRGSNIYNRSILASSVSSSSSSSSLSSSSPSPSSSSSSSSSLSSSGEKKEKRSDSSRMSLYGQLAKFRLSSLVVMTSGAGYACYGAAIDPITFSACTVGTALCAGSANAFNQVSAVYFISCIHVYVNVCIHTYIHTYTYIHTFDTYIVYRQINFLCQSSFASISMDQ